MLIALEGSFGVFLLSLHGIATQHLLFTSSHFSACTAVVFTINTHCVHIGPSGAFDLSVLLIIHPTRVLCVAFDRNIVKRRYAFLLSVLKRLIYFTTLGYFVYFINTETIVGIPIMTNDFFNLF